MNGATCHRPLTLSARTMTGVLGRTTRRRYPVLPSTAEIAHGQRYRAGPLDVEQFFVNLQNTLPPGIVVRTMEDERNSLTWQHTINLSVPKTWTLQVVFVSIILCHTRL